MSWGRSSDSLHDRNMGSHFPSCKSSLQLKGKFHNEKSISRKRPNDRNAGKNELIPKKRASGLSDDVNASSGMHSWDALLQKRGNVEEGKHVDDGKGMPTERKASSLGECLNSHPSWPSWNSCLQKDRISGATNSRSALQSWNSWQQNRRGAEHSKDISQKRVSRSGDRVGSHYDKPPLKSRLGKRINCEDDKALVDGGYKSSNKPSRWVSPGSQVKTTDRVTKDVSWKRSSNSSDHLQVPSSRLAWESELQIRNNAEGLKSTLEETTSKVIKSLKKNDSTRDRTHRRAESSADNARPDRRSNLKKSCSGSAEMDNAKPCTPKSLQERSNSRNEANDGLSQGGNSIIAAESPSERPSQNSDVQKRNGNKEVTHGCRKEAAVHLPILPSRNPEGRGKRDREDARDVYNKEVMICISQACTSFPSLISYREETNNIGEEMDTLDLVAFNKNDDERLSLGMASLEPRTTVQTNGSSDGPVELTASGWAAPAWKCTEQTQSNPIKGNDTSAERAINLIESAGLPSTGTSAEVEMVCKGNEQAKDGSDEKIPDIIESAESGCSWHSDEHNIQGRRNLRVSDFSHSTTLQSILHSPITQRSVSEEPNVVADELHLPEEGNVGEPNARADDMTLNEIKGAVFPSVGSCVKPTLHIVEDVNVLPREEAPNSVHDKDIRDTHGEKTFTLIDGSKFPHSEPVLELGDEGDIEEHSIGRVEGRFGVHIYQSTNEDPDMVGGLETMVADSACTKHPNSPTTSNSATALPKYSVCGETQINNLNMFHAIIVCPQNFPAKKCIWKGNFEVTDIASVVRVFEGFSAHPSFKVCRRAYDFSLKMPSTVEFLVHPRSKHWPMIFEDCPDTNDVALYFYPKNEQATHGYTSLLRFIDSKDLMLRSQMSGDVELLVFPSRLLDVKCQTIRNSYFFWGVFRIKRK